MTIRQQVRCHSEPSTNLSWEVLDGQSKSGQHSEQLEVKGPATSEELTAIPLKYKR